MIYVRRHCPIACPRYSRHESRGMISAVDDHLLNWNDVIRAPIVWRSQEFQMKKGQRVLGSGYSALRPRLRRQEGGDSSAGLEASLSATSQKSQMEPPIPMATTDIAGTAAAMPYPPGWPSCLVPRDPPATDAIPQPSHTGRWQLRVRR
jgi:hypothetical protein